MGNTKMKTNNKNIKRPSKESVLAYQHPDLVCRFSELYGVTKDEAEDVFNQMKLWLWLGNERMFDIEKTNSSDEERTSMFIDIPLLVIDEMWHNFILFTKDYFYFCQKLFGHYLHHSPTTEKEKIKFKEEVKNLSTETIKQRETDRKREQYTYLFDKLGKDAFKKFYFTYPDKYTPKTMAEMYAYSALPNVNLTYPSSK